MATFGGYTGRRGDVAGARMPGGQRWSTPQGQSEWERLNFAAHARRNWGYRPPQGPAPRQTGFMGMYGRREDWQDPWRGAAVPEQRSAGYGQRSTGIEPETAWAKWLRTRGDPRIGGTGALQPRGPAAQTTGPPQELLDMLKGFDPRMSMSTTNLLSPLIDTKTGIVRGGGSTPRQTATGWGGATGSAATPAFGTPPTPEALAMRDELDVIPGWLQDQYGDISQYGQLGSEGMRTIDQPMFRQEEAVLGSIDPFMERMTGLYGEQTRSSLDRIRDEGAQRRRRATSAAGRSLGRMAGQRPGLATQMMAEAAAPVTAAQAGMEFEAEQRGTGLEQNLLGSAYDMANQILMGRGGRRAELELQNQLSKSQVGLPGVAGASQYQADLLGNRYWDLTDPMAQRYSYQTGLMGVGQGMDLQTMAIRQRYGQLNAEQQMKLQQEMEAWMAENNYGQYQDPEFWEVFNNTLQGIGEIVPG